MNNIFVIGRSIFSKYPEFIKFFQVEENNSRTSDGNNLDLIRIGAQQKI